MSESTPDPKDRQPEPRRSQDQEAKLFYERLEQTGQLVDVGQHEDVSKLPARVTHVRYPDGTVKRIRFTGSGHH
jgi:allantoicase